MAAGTQTIAEPMTLAPAERKVQSARPQSMPSNAMATQSADVPSTTATTAVPFTVAWGLDEFGEQVLFAKSDSGRGIKDLARPQIRAVLDR